MPGLEMLLFLMIPAVVVPLYNRRNFGSFRIYMTKGAYPNVEYVFWTNRTYKTESDYNRDEIFFANFPHKEFFAGFSGISVFDGNDEIFRVNF